MKKYIQLTMKLLTFVFLFQNNGNFIYSQQFNCDSYVTMPHGTGTFVLTTGQRNASMYATFTLLPKFELNFSTSMYWPVDSLNSPQHFSTNIFGKYMFWVNKNKNGGAAIFLGMGQSPGFYTKGDYSALHKNYWTALPVTIPFFNNTISWDIMPGALVDLDYGNDKKTAWGFTYSSRIAIYKIIPKTAIVAEVYGTSGDAYSAPEYKVGLRWEPNDYIIPAVSFGSAIDGTKGAGFEIGIIIFTPQYLKKSFIKENKIEY